MSSDSRFNDALDQLLSYSTWRESRLASILVVRNKDVAQIAANAQPVIERRPEFEHWLVGAHGQKARIRWTVAKARTATLALKHSHKLARSAIRPIGCRSPTTSTL